MGQVTLDSTGTGGVYVGGALVLSNGKWLCGQDTGGASHGIIGLDTANLSSWWNSLGTRVRIVNQAYTTEIWSCDNSGNMAGAGGITSASVTTGPLNAGSNTVTCGSIPSCATSRMSHTNASTSGESQTDGTRHC